MPRCHVQYMCLSAERPPVQPNLALVVLPAPAELVDQESSDSTPTPQPPPRPADLADGLQAAVRDGLDRGRAEHDLEHREPREHCGRVASISRRSAVG